MSSGVIIGPGQHSDVSEYRTLVVTARASTRRRSAVVSVALLAAVVFLVAVSVSVGDFVVALPDVVPALFGRGDDGIVLVVQEFRLPRVLTGLLVGLGFGVSGAIFQSVSRNPLASPDILGVMSGASVAAIFILTVAQASGAMMPVAAFGGGILTASVIYVLAYRKGVSSYRLVLIGIGVGAVAVAGIEYLLTRASLTEAATATAWLAGSLNGRGWQGLGPLTVASALLLPSAAVLARQLGVLQLGDDTCKGLGVRVELARLGLLIVAVAVASVGTAAAGPIAFVALLAPAIARRLTRTPLALTSAALMGAALVLVADLVGRVVFPTEIPVGIITGIIGAPYLLWLLARANKIGRGG
jgi:iron complex transport system permease protein